MDPSSRRMKFSFRSEIAAQFSFPSLVQSVGRLLFIHLEHLWNHLTGSKSWSSGGERGKKEWWSNQDFCGSIQLGQNTFRSWVLECAVITRCHASHGRRYKSHILFQINLTLSIHSNFSSIFDLLFNKDFTDASRSL